jgi:hypothetical protein
MQNQRRSEERNATRASAASRVPLLGTPPEGFSSSSYKHATPNGVKTVNACSWGGESTQIGWGIECWFSINYDVPLTKDDKVIEEQH